MAMKKEEMMASFPLPAYNFRVVLEEEAVAFSQVSGLNMQYEPIVYRHGLSWKEGPEHVAGLKGEVTLTLQKGIVRKGSVLLEWISDTYALGIWKRDLEIHLCDENGKPVVTWHVRKAFPTSLEVPTFEAGSNEVAVESMELKAETIQVEYADEGQAKNL